MLDLEYKRSSKFWTNSFKSNSYTNWDIGVGAFANYFITENTYLIGGVALLYEFSGSKERRTLKSLEDYNDVLLDEQFMKKIEDIQFYAKSTIMPKLGIGIQCNKRFAIEFSVFDQIQKVEYDCSSMYKLPVLKAFCELAPEITDILPDKKQSSWINRFGAELDFRLDINDKFFTKLGLFYIFPRNITKKIKPFDLKLQSVGVSLTFGITF